MQDRDSTIQEKERHVYALKKKNQELEKFKFVLDYRIKELKTKVEPRETHIRDMTTQISQMNTQLESLSAQKTEYTSTISEIESKLGAQKKLYQTHHRKAHTLTHTIRSFLTDLTALPAYLQDSTMLQAAVERLENKYLAGMDREELRHVGMDPEVEKEVVVQEGVLRERIRGLRRVVEGNKRACEADEVGSVVLNRGLIAEINRLRQMNKQSAKQIKNLQVLAITEVPSRSISSAGGKR